MKAEIPWCLISWSQYGTELAVGITSLVDVDDVFDEVDEVNEINEVNAAIETFAGWVAVAAGADEDVTTNAPLAQLTATNKNVAIFMAN